MFGCDVWFGLWPVGCACHHQILDGLALEGAGREWAMIAIGLTVTGDGLCFNFKLITVDQSSLRVVVGFTP